MMKNSVCLVEIPTIFATQGDFLIERYHLIEYNASRPHHLIWLGEYILKYVNVIDPHQANQLQLYRSNPVHGARWQIDV